MYKLTNVIKQTTFRRFIHKSAPTNFDLGGIFVPIPTPYQSDGSIDYGALAANFQIWETIPFKGTFTVLF